MALTKESALFYWDALYGVQPVVGGDPVHSRDSAGWFLGRAGLYRKAIKGIPRFEPTELDGIVRPAMLLENSNREDVAGAAETDGSDWTVAGLTRTTATSILGADGSAAKLVTTGSTPTPQVHAKEVQSATGAPQAWTWILERLSYNHIRCGVWDATTAAWSVYYNLDMDTGALTAVTGAADAAYAEKLSDAGPNGGEVWRVVLIKTVTAGNGLSLYYYPCATGGSTVPRGSFLHYGGKINNPYGTSPIPGADGTVRSADSFYWKTNILLSADHGTAFYCRAKMTADLLGAGSGNYNLFSAGSTTAGGVGRLQLYGTAGGGFRLYLHDGSTAGQTAQILSDAVPGDDLEFMGLCTSTGSLRLYGRRNGGTVSDSGALAGPTPPSEKSHRVWLNEVEGSNKGAAKYGRLALVKYTDLAAAGSDRLDELAAYELGPTGDLLVS